MEGVIGILKVRVIRGINLAIRDAHSDSDPYLVASLDNQKTKTRVIKDNNNPVWDDELTLMIKDPEKPVNITVYDKDTLSSDDIMGSAEIDLKPIVENLNTELNLHLLTNGTKLEKVPATKDNCLLKESYVVWNDGKITQDMTLGLRNVECGEIELQIELIPVRDHKLNL